MSEETSPRADGAPAADPARPDMMRFRRTGNAVRMPPEQGRRQGEIVTLALAAFGNKDAALAFLNAQDAELEARPIDVAMDSAAGYAAVAARIAALT